MPDAQLPALPLTNPLAKSPMTLERVRLLVIPTNFTPSLFIQLRCRFNFGMRRSRLQDFVLWAIVETAERIIAHTFPLLATHIEDYSKNV